MSYVYKNITSQPQLIAVMNESRTDVSHVPLSPGARIEVNEPSLDMYMPHILARLNEAGNDITHIILRQKEQQKQYLSQAEHKPAPAVEKEAEPRKVVPAAKEEAETIKVVPTASEKEAVKLSTKQEKKGK